MDLRSKVAWLIHSSHKLVCGCKEMLSGQNRPLHINHISSCVATHKHCVCVIDGAVCSQTSCKSASGSCAWHPYMIVTNTSMYLMKLKQQSTTLCMCHQFQACAWCAASNASLQKLMQRSNYTLCHSVENSARSTRQVGKQQICCCLTDRPKQPHPWGSGATKNSWSIKNNNLWMQDLNRSAIWSLAFLIEQRAQNQSCQLENIANVALHFQHIDIITNSDVHTQFPSNNMDDINDDISRYPDQHHIIDGILIWLEARSAGEFSIFICRSVIWIYKHAQLLKIPVVSKWVTDMHIIHAMINNPVLLRTFNISCSALHHNLNHHKLRCSG